MGILDNLRARKNFGSIQETVIHIIKPIKEYGVTSFANETEAMSLFSILLGQRAQAAMFAGETKGNLLLDTGIDKIYRNYEECFGEQILFSLKIDLPLFVFTAMYLESPNFRQGIREADLILKKEVFNTIHTVSEHYYFNLVRFPDIMAFDNMVKLSAYLSKKYPV
jgi:hypothetical protein